MKIDELIKLVSILREKCPWDNNQTLESLKNNVIEEAYEIAEAIEDNNTSAIKEEIGDILFLGLFLVKVLEEEKGVSADSLISTAVKKYKKKHPHVFKTEHLPDQDAVLRYWQRSKVDMFNGIPKTLPALLAAKVIQERAAKVGFDWHSYKGPLKKVDEEIQEVKMSIGSKNLFEEFGDLLFACVNLARHLQLDPEDALRYANKKFVRRFKKIENELKKRGANIEDTSLEEMNRIWDELKRK
jgi:tetrapyrrole methylase family protein/MazG family protein